MPTPTSITVTIPLYTQVAATGEFVHLGDATVEVPLEFTAQVDPETLSGRMSMDIPASVLTGVGTPPPDPVAPEPPPAPVEARAVTCTCDINDVEGVYRLTLGPHHGEECPLSIQARRRLIAPVTTEHIEETLVAGDIGDTRAGD